MRNLRYVRAGERDLWAAQRRERDQNERRSFCGFCGRYLIPRGLEKPDDPGIDCGGDCAACMQEHEAAMGWVEPETTA